MANFGVMDTEMSDYVGQECTFLSFRRPVKGQTYSVSRRISFHATTLQILPLGSTFSSTGVLYGKLLELTTKQMN